MGKTPSLVQAWSAPQVMKKVAAVLPCTQLFVRRFLEGDIHVKWLSLSGDEEQDQLILYARIAAGEHQEALGVVVH
jgi:hypothetical protein